MHKFGTHLLVYVTRSYIRAFIVPYTDYRLKQDMLIQDMLITQETCTVIKPCMLNRNEWNVNVEINLESFSLIGKSGCKNQPPPRYYTVMYLQPLLIKDRRRPINFSRL